MDVVRDILLDGMNRLGIVAGDESIGKLLQFQGLLSKWNRVYNLSGIRDPEEMVRLHLLDSLAIAKYLPGDRVADIGTGAGLPGIPLALLDREKTFYLVDCDAKKTRFVRQAVIELKLTNVEVYNSRAENLELPVKVDVIVARAFSSLHKIMKKTEHLLTKDGVILALKGHYPGRELELLADIPHSSIPLDVPGVDAERHLISIIPGRRLSENREPTAEKRDLA